MTVRLWGLEQAVNTTTLGQQGSPSIAQLVNGDMVVVWEDMSAGGGQIRARIYATDGTPRGPEFDIAATAAAETDPVVVALANGGFHVTFEEGSKLKTLTFYSNGDPNGDVHNWPFASEVAAVDRGAGEAMVQTYLFNSDVWVTTYAADGTVVTDKKVNTTGLGASPESAPDIAVLKSGALTGCAVAVWVQNSGSVYGRIIDGQGQPVGAADFKIDQSGLVNTSAPKVAALESGFVVMWTEGGGVDQTPEVFARVYDDAGAPTASVFQVNTGTAGHQSLGDVVGLSDGGFIAIWLDEQQLTGQRFNAQGDRMGTEFQVGTSAGLVDDARGISAVLMDDGRVAVTWENAGGDGLDKGVRMQILDPRDGDIKGGFYDDVLLGSAYDDQILGNGGHDNIYAGGGVDQVFGGIGIDELWGDAGDDLLFGQADNDTLVGGAGEDRLDGGAGADTADFSDKTKAVVLTLAGATEAVARVGGFDEDVVLNVENITGGKAGDTLTGDSGANKLTGLEGNDVLKGGGGADSLFGGAGVDVADYRDKTDTVTLTLAGGVPAVVVVGGDAEDYVAGIENVYGGSSGDSLTGDDDANLLNGFGGGDMLMGGGGKDVLIGGLGVDSADYRDKTEAISVALKGGYSVAVKVGGVVEDTIRGIENLYGGQAADTLTGDGLANLFRGGSGADVIDGKGGADVIDFGDHLEAVILTLNGATQVTATVGGTASDKVKNVEGVFGGGGADVLTGDGFKNVLQGGSGTDTLKGRGGADTLTGGFDADTFVYSFLTDSTVAQSGRDTIMDFNSAQGDKIDLSGIDAVSGGANNAFTFGPMQAGAAGRLQVSVFDDDGFLVEGDVTGDGAADFAIVVYTAFAPVEGDFIL